MVPIELSKVKAEYERNKKNKKAQWALFINDPNTEEVKEIMKDNKDIEEAVITVHEMTEDEHMRRMADLREKAIMDEKAIRRKGYEDGQKAGVEAGKVAGRAEERKENAKRMKELKMTNEQICQILNITQEELKKLLDN